MLALLVTQAVLLGTSCVTAGEVRPSPTLSPVVTVTSEPTPPSSLSGVRRWPLPDLLAWDIASESLLYVAQDDPRKLHLLDLKTGSRRSAVIPDGLRIVGAAMLKAGVLYVAGTAGAQSAPTSFEIRLFTWSSATDKLIDTVAPVVEPGQAEPLVPSVITDSERQALVWNRFDVVDGEITTELRKLDQSRSTSVSLIRSTGVLTPKVMTGDGIVIWKRSAGSGDSYASTATILLADGREHLILDGAWNVTVAPDGRVVIERGASAEIRSGAKGNLLATAPLNSFGVGTIYPPVLAGQRLAWCTETGVLGIFDIQRGTSESHRADGCSSQIHLDDASVTWMSVEPDRFALVRLSLP